MNFKFIGLFLSLLLINGCPTVRQRRAEVPPPLGEVKSRVSSVYHEVDQGYEHEEREIDIVRESDVSDALPAAGSFVNRVVRGPTTVCQAGEKREEPITESGADQVHPELVLDDRGAHMKEVLVCILDKVYPPPPPAIARMRTVDFMSNRVADNFISYNMTNKTEQAHVLANLIHESAGLTTSVENLPRSERWRATRRGTSPTWDKELYETAIDGDNEFFDNRYVHSRDKYKAKFRGRGLVQMTGCTNYLSFLLSYSAKQAGNEELANRSVESFHYKDRAGRLRKVSGMHCNDQMWKSAIEQIQEDYGVPIVPPEFINNFEETANKLSVPNPDVKIDPMSSQDFVVDSAFHFWKRCRRNYPEAIVGEENADIADSVACVHGAPAAYRKKENQTCPYNGNYWIHQSFCSRKKLFVASQECLKGIEFVPKS